MRTDDEIRADWRGHLLSTEPADRPRAESALRELYSLAELAPPEHIFWLDSPFAAAWAVGLLSEQHDFIWQRIIEAASRRKSERDYMDQVRAKLCESVGQPDWKTLVAEAGEHLSGARMRVVNATARVTPVASLHGLVAVSRFELYENVADGMPRLDEQDELYRTEHHFRQVIGGQAGWSIVNPLISGSFHSQYGFSTMAQDEAAARGRDVPHVLAAAWEVARSAGPWWPLSNSTVVSDRPLLMDLNEQHQLHRGGGPAAEFRDGTRVWAWNGHAMRENWIMNPEGIPARELKLFDASFREYAATRIVTSGPTAKLKPSAILKKELPADAEARMALLRKHNRGNLPLFDRYLAGEHEEVWNELAALGPVVRNDPHAADALAVAYETMRRVETNVRKVTARLQALGYRFSAPQAHEPPDARVRKQVARLEKAVGGIPLALRAFYDVVGAVDWTGDHTSIAPRGDSLAPDPLVVFPVEDALALCEDGFGDGSVIMIAPDDLHKAKTSGCEPYEIEVPDLGADGKLLNERHELYFVDYLRLVFRFGGFPGYEGIDRALPPELAELCGGLISF